MSEPDQRSAAEQVVARLDSYSQEQHAEGLAAARARLAARVERRKRAIEAARRLRGESGQA